MSLLLPVGTIPVGIQQLITSGSQFDGAVSTTTATSGQGMTKYPTDTKGGFFNFENNEPIVVHHILADFGVAVTYTFSVVNLDAAGAVIAGESLVFATGTAASFIQTTSIVLGTKQAVKLVTSGGAGAAKVARVWATTFRGYQG
jgi:hypothetical protein